MLCKVTSHVLAVAILSDRHEGMSSAGPSIIKQVGLFMQQACIVADTTLTWKALAQFKRTSSVPSGL